jgi:hypothetical protein
MPTRQCHMVPSLLNSRDRYILPFFWEFGNLEPRYARLFVNRWFVQEAHSTYVVVLFLYARLQ